MELSEKLNKIRKELVVPKNNYNKFGGFYYRNQEDILEAVKPLLEKYNATLNITDDMIQIGDRYYCKAIVSLIDGEQSIKTTAFAREPENKKGMDLPQISGTVSSYARKYALGGLFLLDDVKDSDNNNNEVNNTEIDDSPPSDAFVEIIKIVNSDLIPVAKKAEILRNARPMKGKGDEEQLKLLLHNIKYEFDIEE